MLKKVFFTIIIAFFQLTAFGQSGNGKFVKVKGLEFYKDEKPYYYIGTNYWYGMNLGAEAAGGDRERLKRELDHLKSLGINNLRVMAATEGPDTEPNRVKPSLQPQKGVYNEQVLEGLDFLLAEMRKRDMTAVMVMNNFWEWTGGMGQYNVWAKGGSIPYAPPAGTGDWDTFQKFSATFYNNKEANQLYRNHLKFIINHKNKFTAVKYKEDPTIMAWQLGNEPRGYNNREEYLKWLDATAGFIKKLDKNHLVSIGSEGNTASHHAGNDFYKDHQSPNIDYATMHIWIQNWSWFNPHKADSTLPVALKKGKAYLLDHLENTRKLNKPMVLEEFGVARDNESYFPSSSTGARDTFYKMIFETAYEAAKEGKGMAGINFWTYAGEGRPDPDSPDHYWKEGDELMGDPPHEKQGWYSVFDSDSSTLAIIEKYADLFNSLNKKDGLGRK